MDSDALFAKTALPYSSSQTKVTRLRPSRTMPTLQKQKTVQRFSAKMQFMRTFREFSAAGQRRAWHSQLNPQLEYLGELQRQRLMPEPGMFCSSSKLLNLDGFRMGDSYAAAVSRALSMSDSVESLNLRSNRLREGGALKLINAISPYLRELNLSENKLGDQSVSALANALADPDSLLETLGLEKALTRNEHVCTLLAALHENKHLKSLNLARNGLGILTAKALKTFLARNIGVETLDLHWNSLNGPAAVLALSGLAANSHLRVLDLSWNALGRSPLVSSALSRVVKENSTLQHLDLSNNYLTSSDIDLVAEGLRSNHTILGVHVEGNEGVQDAMGFLQPDSRRRKDIDGHLSPRMMSRVAYRSVKKPAEACWLCNKWQETAFHWDRKDIIGQKRGKIDSDGVPLLHLDIDHYQPCAMEEQFNGGWKVVRALPRHTVKFFFTSQGQVQVSSAYSVQTLLNPLTVRVELVKEVIRSLEVVMVNELVPMGRLCSLDEAFPVEPRNPDWLFHPVPMVAEYPPAPQWTISNSIFKNYKFDTEAVLRESMNFDLRHSKTPYLFGSSEAFARVQPTLELAYKHL